MPKQYENPKLRTYFNKEIKNMTIDDKFKPYIVEILMRRLYQYDLNTQEIHDDVHTILNTLQTIKTVDSKELSEKTIMGIYYPYERKILINNNYVKNDIPEKIFSTLTHEVYHALAKDPHTMEDKIGNRNRITGQYNNVLLETIVEKSAYKTVFNTEHKENLYYNNNASGYSNITFILDALEATYGINEQALLTNGIRGRKKLIEFLSAVGGETKEDASIFLDKIEMNMSQIYNVLYKNPKMSKTEKNENIKYGLVSLKTLCESKLKDRIMNTEIKEQKKGEEIVENFKFDSNKLNVIFEKTAKDYESYESGFGVEEFLKSDKTLNNQTTETIKRISDIESILKNSDKLDEKEEQILINWAKNGNLQNYDKAHSYLKKIGKVSDDRKLSDYGITVLDAKKINPQKNFRIDVEKFKDKRLDDIFFSDGWDNSNILNIKNDFRKSSLIMQFFKNVVKKIKNRNNPKLAEFNTRVNVEEPKYSIDTERDNFLAGLKVSKETLKANAERNNSQNIEKGNINKSKSSAEIEYMRIQN